MKKQTGLLWFVAAVVLAVLLLLFRDKLHIHFDWGMFWSQLKHVDWRPEGAAAALIYAMFWMRSARWAVFVSPTKKIGYFSTVGAQFIGFTAVGLFGRLADLTRPYLIAKKVQLSLSSQIAVYTIERMFDLAAAAIIFSIALAFTPKGLPQHAVFAKTGLFSLALTLALALFAISVRAVGGAVASLTRSVLGRLSQAAAESVSQKILDFRDGLNALSSFREFAIVLAMSLAMWAGIGLAYVEVLHGFVDTAELATIGYSQTMLLMAASIGGSMVQLPVVGWFTQIGVTAAAMRTFFGAPVESATACGALLLLVLNLSILPAGLLFAQIGRVSLKQAAEESGAAAETGPPAVSGPTPV